MKKFLAILAACTFIATTSTAVAATSPVTPKAPQTQTQKKVAKKKVEKKKVAKKAAKTAKKTVKKANPKK